MLNSLRQELKKEETGPKANAELANVVNAMVKEGLPEEKLQEKLNKYHRPENCESLRKVRVNQSISDQQFNCKMLDSKRYRHPSSRECVH